MSKSSVDFEAQLIERVVEKRALLLDNTKKKVSQIKKSTEEELVRIEANSKEEILGLIGSELKATRDRIVGSAHLEGRRILMFTRQEILSGVYGEASKKLADVAEGKDKDVDYGKALLSLVTEAAINIGGEELIISVNERDLKYIKNNLVGLIATLKESLGECTVRLDDEPIDALGGVVVKNGDATKTYYNTLEGRLGSVRSKLQSQVAGMLGVL